MRAWAGGIRTLYLYAAHNGPGSALPVGATGELRACQPAGLAWSRQECSGS